jgi:hypothetical protein
MVEVVADVNVDWRELLLRTEQHPGKAKSGPVSYNNQKKGIPRNGDYFW